MTSAQSEHSTNLAEGRSDIWLRFLMFPGLAFSLYPFFIAGAGGDGIIVRSLWVTFLSYCWFCVGGAFHEAAHETLFANRNANRFVGMIIGSIVFIPLNAYRETHRLHHAYLNSSRDYEMWPYCDPKASLWFRRLFVVFDIVLGVASAPLIYGRIWLLRNSPLAPAVRRTISMEYLICLVFWGTAITTFLVRFIMTGRTWADFRIEWILPLVLSSSANSVRKLVEHLGMPSTDPILGTRTIAGGNAYSRLCRYFNFNISVHGPHHRFPRLSYTELSPKLQQYRSQHPELQVPVFASYLAAFVNMLPSLRNPASGEGLNGESNSQKTTTDASQDADKW